VIRALQRLLSSIAAYVRTRARRNRISISDNPADAAAIDRTAMAIAAHDCFNLLAIMVACADAMRRTHPNKHACDDDVVEFHRAADRLERVAHQLLATGLASHQNGQLVDLNALIARSEGMLARVLPDGIFLQLQLTPVRGVVRADPWDIERILLNLVVQVGRDVPDGSVVAVQTVLVQQAPHGLTAPNLRARTFIRVTVADSGAVLRPRSRVVPYFSKSRQVDNKLRLGMVARSVQQLNGALHIESDSERRMRICVDFPLIIGGSEEDTLELPERAV
jgi:nitrogen-specific signal transduction histidine kinase